MNQSTGSRRSRAQGAPSLAAGITPKVIDQAMLSFRIIKALASTGAFCINSGTINRQLFIFPYRLCLPVDAKTGVFLL